MDQHHQTECNTNVIIAYMENLLQQQATYATIYCNLTAIRAQFQLNGQTTPHLYSRAISD